ncbi:hypothetical protein BA893_04910 [Vibrio natriegens]|uniref:hypothetical protein n=1 Tax=Vibrio natriegens TaxID=691 RepID=UPI000804592D|nr:hypothetical protein [Vibrio natriegens]ANQ21035.1 hypothetical protein BA893_04910 [Vibrio natriegens]
MDAAVVAKRPLKTVGKWLGVTIASAVLLKFTDPLTDWIIDTIVSVSSRLSDSYMDGIYTKSANVYLESSVSIVIPLIFALVLLISATYAAARFSSKPEYNRTPFFMWLSANVCLVLVSASAVKYTSSNAIRSSTLSQLEIIKPYTDNTDELYSQFLLVQGKEDYIKVWSEIYTIAAKNDVVLPRFEVQGEQGE